MPGCYAAFPALGFVFLITEMTQAPSDSYLQWMNEGFQTFTLFQTLNFLELTVRSGTPSSFLTNYKSE